MEPEDDFGPPIVGSTVCCKVKGVKYSAKVLAIEKAIHNPCKVSKNILRFVIISLCMTSCVVTMQKKIHQGNHYEDEGQDTSAGYKT